MKLSHLSASSIKTWEACTAQWHDRYVNKASQGEAGAAANLGGLIHECLEEHVKSGDYTRVDAAIALLRRWENIANANGLGGSADESEGLKMLARWADRQDWSDREIVSTEQEWTFNLNLSPNVQIPVKFIIDRVDRADGDLEIFDYKSGVYQHNHEGLRNDVQAKTYATACWLDVPGQAMYWVTFDYLRDEPVSVGFRPEELEAHYQWLCNLAKTILETPEDAVKETINPTCRFCHRKFECDALRDIKPKGFPALMSLEQIASHRIELHHASKAIETMLEDLDRQLKKAFEEDDTLPHVAGKGDQATYAVTMGSQNQRWVDMGVVRSTLTPSEMAAFAKPGVKDIEEMVRNLPPDRAADLKKALKAGKTRQSLKVIANPDLL